MRVDENQGEKGERREERRGEERGLRENEKFLLINFFRKDSEKETPSNLFDIPGANEKEPVDTTHFSSESEEYDAEYVLIVVYNDLHFIMNNLLVLIELFLLLYLIVIYMDTNLGISMSHQERLFL
jgi:hypothetical protein